MNDTTVILYDINQFKRQGYEFEDVSTPRGVVQVNRRVAEMCSVMVGLKAYFDGEIEEINLHMRDKRGNTRVLEGQPLMLTVNYLLTLNEVRYIKSIDPYLIAIM